MTKFLPAVCWAIAIILFAFAGRLGWADRHAVTSMLIIMPMLAFVSMQRVRRCATSAREA
jgi:hypothetical protein